MIPRFLATHLQACLKRFPAVVLVGPRQVGKTTLARSLPGKYFDLEKPQDRLRVDVEWESLVTGRDLVTFDEAQNHPEVFPRMRSAIDEERKRNGRFLLQRHGVGADCTLPESDHRSNGGREFLGVHVRL
jgi:predicted AAA+ superfamily ATPase